MLGTIYDLVVLSIITYFVQRLNSELGPHKHNMHEVDGDSPPLCEARI